MNENWILLIDPFKNLVNAYRILLEEEEFSVEMASNLEEASERFKKRKYSVILTEYLPPFEAYDTVIERMKQSSPETYLIMVTNAAVDEKTYERLFAIGVDDFILKPYSPEKLLVHIKKGLKQRALVLKVKELEKLSLLDPMTQEAQGLILNSLFFKSCLRQEMKKAKRHQHPLSLLLIQMPSKEEMGDRFNPFYQEIVKIFRSSTREEDIMGKNNGDIGILLPETDQVGSQALIQRLLNLIRTHPQFMNDENLKFHLQTLSFQSYTYPNQFGIPESLKAVLEDIEKGPPYH